MISWSFRSREYHKGIREAFLMTWGFGKWSFNWTARFRLFERFKFTISRGSWFASPLVWILGGEPHWRLLVLNKCFKVIVLWSRPWLCLWLCEMSLNASIMSVLFRFNIGIKHAYLLWLINWQSGILIIYSLITLSPILWSAMARAWSWRDSCFNLDIYRFTSKVRW